MTIHLPPFLELVGIVFGSIAAAFVIFILWTIFFCISDEAGEWAFVARPLVTLSALALSIWGLSSLTSG